MRYRHCFLIALLFLFSCSDRIDGLETLNHKPEIYLVKDSLTTSLVDSIRLFPGEQVVYNFKVKVIDKDANNWKVKYVVDEGELSFLYQGMPLAYPSIRADVPEVELSAVPRNLGINEFRIVAEDRFKQTSEVKVRLFCFSNLLPVAELSVTPIGPFEYEFDASASYDLDQRFGGRVESFEFTVAGVRFRSALPQFRHVFSAPGTYVVKVVAFDNNGAASASKEIRVLVS